jgi:hypothetical protein
MRISTKLLAALTGVLVLAVAPNAVAAPSMSMSMRDWVPENALTSYRALAGQFDSPAAAEAAGYTKISDKAGIFCIADPAGSGAMGVHWVNFNLLFDHQLNPGAPEAIVYEPRPDGSYHLVALEYIVFQADFAQAPALFAGHPFMSTGADNRFGLDAYYSQHVWVGKGNPLGNLSMWNPAVHCR